MEALAVRMSQLGSDVEAAVRIVMFYDTLMRRRVDLPALARASANLAECTAGIRLAGTGRTIRMTSDGREAPGAPAVTTSAPVTLDDEEIGTVWLERPSPTGLLDELLLDRLAIAVATAVERYGPAHTTMADPALVELVIGADTDEAARARALRLLGFAADLPVHAIAVRTAPAHGAAPTLGTTPTLDRIGTLLCPGRPVKAAQLADAGAVLATTVDVTHLPPGIRAGIGAAAAPDRSWREARTALRFTTPRRPVVHHAELGAVALLADLPADTVRANPDVAAIARIAERSPEDLETLDAYCTTGSLRRAATVLHLHHTSVARRLDQPGTALGVELTEPAGLLRATLALTMWRLHAEPPAPGRR
ncbi:helix-turn-helix domain-containing protein [Kitasatospora sp. NPDC093558]|uniref:helix-turn-helix domain-containing protein n=1 Tax=Kitasatospora sp. NPDC093558 TaxID=3155201 RepID=UPI00341EAB90